MGIGRESQRDIDPISPGKNDKVKGMELTSTALDFNCEPRLDASRRFIRHWYRQMKSEYVPPAILLVQEGRVATAVLSHA